MELVLLIVLILINIFGFIYSGRKVYNALPKAPQSKAITTSDHHLVKTWIEADSTTAVSGWRAKCSCGALQYATNAKSTTYDKAGSYGSEINVIEAFERHAKAYARVNGNPDMEKLSAVQKEFDEYKEKCYCKETQTVALLPLRG